MFALLALGMMAVAIRVEAQSVGLSVVASPSPVGISNNLTYTITVTNLSLTETSENYIITNTLPTSAQFQSASPSGSYVNNGNIVTFSFTGLAWGGVVQMTVTALPTTAGLITDSVFVISGDLQYSASASVSTQVTNPVVQQADLAVGMTGPAALVFANDWMVYGVNVTNLGPDTASGIFLTNTLPPGVGFKSVSPAFTRLGSGSNVIFNLGTLTNQAFINFQLTVQPTNAGTLTFVSVVSTNSVFDPNPANNSASINVVVSNFFSGQLLAYTNSAQVPNGQVGYLEQTIVVSNTGPTTVAAARVIVSGLTNRLANAVGTNNGNPFVVYGSTLDTNQSVNLLLQFYPNRTSFAFGNSQLHPVEVTPPNLSPPSNLSSNINFTGIFQMPSGGMLLEFPTVTNRTYTVEYSSNLFSTNWLAVQPALVAPANYTFWIDYGPPATLSHPTNSAMRFYRVFLNP